MSKLTNAFYGYTILEDDTRIRIQEEEDAKKFPSQKTPIDLINEEVERTYHTSKLSEETVRTALQAANGWLSKAAEILNVPIGAVQYAIYRHPGLKIYLNDLRQGLVDFVENKLMKRIESGDREAIIYFLRCHGKNRGWNDKAVEQQANDTAKVVINITPAYAEAPSPVAIEVQRE